LVDASELFFDRLERKILPNDKRTAIRWTFYVEVLTEVIKKSGAKFLLQGTILTDIEATAKDSAAPQHNVLKQIGLTIGDVEIIEPLAELRKPSVRVVARVLGLPEAIWNRMPFPGPALAARIIGEVTREKIAVIRKVTAIVEKELPWVGAFQYLAVLVSDMVPNHDRTKLGYAVVIECIRSKDATAAEAILVDQNLQILIRNKIYNLVPNVFRVAWDLSTKPPAAVEWV
jgi:GMP synthase (glutamine-hydrolysing)